MSMQYLNVSWRVPIVVKSLNSIVIRRHSHTQARMEWFIFTGSIGTHEKVIVPMV